VIPGRLWWPKLLPSRRLCRRLEEGSVIPGLSVAAETRFCDPSQQLWWLKHQKNNIKHDVLYDVTVSSSDHIDHLLCL